MKKFLVYGSYGYTGELIVELAVKNGIKLLLAGRNEKRLKAQAQKYGLEYRAFRLSNTAALDSALNEVDAVLHCAGPFVLTFRQMTEACLRTKRHYLDISGEIEGFEALAQLDGRAKEAGIMLLPGAGFDVVPTDCLSVHLKNRLPSGTYLRLFIRGIGAGVSRGTAKSAIENMHRQARIRKDGTIVTVPAAWRTVKQDFGRGPIDTVTVGWGDVSTAFHSTGIRNVETYMAFPLIAISLMRASRWLSPLLYTRPAKNLLKSMIDLFLPPGPSEERRNKGFALMIGEVTDDKGGRAVSKLQTREGYTFTAQAAVEIMKRISSSELKVGFQTPSRVYGPDFVLQFEGVKRIDE